MLELYKRIKQERERLGLTQEELARRTGYKNKTSITKIEAGQVDIPQSKIYAFAEALHTTPAYLMGWSDDAAGTSSLPDGLMPVPVMQKVPLLGSIACGAPILAAENIDGMVDVPSHIHADFALRCKGDSMIGARIHDGDIVYIRQQPEVENGEIAAVLIGEEATLKRVYNTGGQITLIAENSAFPPMVYAGTQLEDVRIIGKAVAFTSPVK